MGEVLLAAKQAAETWALLTPDIRVINNIGSDGGQVVHHIHFHVLGGENWCARPGNSSHCIFG